MAEIKCIHDELKRFTCVMHDPDISKDMKGDPTFCISLACCNCIREGKQVPYAKKS